MKIVSFNNINDIENIFYKVINGTASAVEKEFLADYYKKYPKRNLPPAEVIIKYHFFNSGSYFFNSGSYEDIE